jgi:hypothetical protein
VQACTRKVEPKAESEIQYEIKATFLRKDKEEEKKEKKDTNIVAYGALSAPYKCFLCCDA